MAFVNYKDKEDMQDDTYKILAELIIDAIHALREKDIERLHADLDSLFCLVWMRLEDWKIIEEELDDIKEGIFSDNQLDDEERSELVDQAKKILKKLTGELDKRGILLRMRSDLDRLTIGGRPDDN